MDTELYDIELDQKFIEYIINCASGKILIICGPTASGKSNFAVRIAKEMHIQNKRASIINSDAMQIYKGLPIITGQPSTNEMSDISHLLYGYITMERFCSITLEKYSVMNWINDATFYIDTLMKNNISPIVVGGTGMYIHSLIFGIAEIPKIDRGITERLQYLKEIRGLNYLYNTLRMHDHEAALKIAPNDEFRIFRALSVFYSTGINITSWQKNNHRSFYPRDNFFILYMQPKRKKLYEKINARIVELFLRNCYEEFLQYKLDLAQLLKKDVKELQLDDLPKIIGIREMFYYSHEERSFHSLIDKIQCITRRYARRQFILFNGKKTNYDFIAY